MALGIRRDGGRGNRGVGGGVLRALGELGPHARGRRALPEVGVVLWEGADHFVDGPIMHHSGALPAATRGRWGGGVDGSARR